MISVFRKVYDLFDRRERRHLMLVLCAVVVMALLEAVGIVSVMPFMALVANPAIVEQQPVLAWLYESLQFESTQSFLFFVGAAVLALIALSNAFTAFTTWAMLSFVWKKHHRLAVQLLERYMGEPYAFHLNHNSATLSKNVLGEVFNVINGVVMPGMQVVARLVVALFIVALLVWVDVVLALVVASVLGGAYGVVYALVRGRQGRLGRERLASNARRYKAAGEAFGGIKELKVLGAEGEFLRAYGEASSAYSRTTASNAIVRQLPRYALETVAVGGIIIIVLYLLRVRQDFAQLLPILSLYAFAGLRLMPALQQIFLGLTQVRFNLAALDELHADLTRAHGAPAADTPNPSPALPLRLEREVRLEEVSFSYPGAPEPALHRVSLCIPRNRTVGLMGSTGSGKTTAADLILALHRPTSGEILVDGVPLGEESLARWRLNVGYVPQSIFLSDDSVLRNIAFGVPAERIDREAAERAARIAHLHDFIRTLPQGYETRVGERGVRLSGGQRQRIGIARALYRDPDLLVMDEATSALDGITEDAVMEAIRELAHSKTILLIAHRLSTLRECDVIYMLEQGRVVASGAYHHLRESSPAFQAMAGEVA